MTGNIQHGVTSLRIGVSSGAPTSVTFYINSNSSILVVNTDWTSHTVWLLSRTQYGIRANLLLDGQAAKNITTSVVTDGVKFTYTGSAGATVLIGLRVGF